MGRYMKNAPSLSCDAGQSIAGQKFLSHMSDTILDEYEEHAKEE
jgi:hypothetical protein